MLSVIDTANQNTGMNDGQKTDLCYTQIVRMAQREMPFASRVIGIFSLVARGPARPRGRCDVSQSSPDFTIM